MQEAFVILFRKVRGNTLATGKERSLCCQLGSGALLKDSGSDLLHHTENWDQQNPKLNSLRDTALSFQKTSGHLITKASLAKILQYEAVKRHFWEQEKATAFPSKVSVTCGPAEWKAGLRSLEHPHAKTYSTLHSSWAHQRVQPDISVQRSLLSKPMMYTDTKQDKFQSGGGESCILQRARRDLTVMCCTREPGRLPFLRMLPGQVGQHVPRCLEGFLQWTTHRTSDSVTTPSWKTECHKHISPEVPLRSDSLWESNQGSRGRVRTPKVQRRVGVRPRGHGTNEVPSPQLRVLMLSNLEHKSCFDPVLGFSLWPKVLSFKPSI